MHILPENGGVLANWLAAAGRNELLLGFDVDEEALRKLEQECAHLHPRYTVEQTKAWAAYSLATHHAHVSAPLHRKAAAPPRPQSAREVYWERAALWAWRAAVLAGLGALIAEGWHR